MKQTYIIILHLMVSWLIFGAESAFAQSRCVDGMAGIYPCDNIDLLAHVPLGEMGAIYGEDLWGWTDPVTGQEIVLYTHSLGTTFVDVSDPINPIVQGILPPVDTAEDYARDVKTIGNYAVITADTRTRAADAVLLDGLQIFDLTTLRSLPENNVPITLTMTAHFTGFWKSHNVNINVETGFAYVSGARGECSTVGGLYIVDLHDPLTPTTAACYQDIGYIHDVQCVIYRGVDDAYYGRELCFAFNTDTLAILDVSDKNEIKLLSDTPYSGAEFSHQGWLTEDHQYLLMNDEYDEFRNGHNGRTYVWQLDDLTAPSIHMTFEQATPSADHNLYIDNNYAYLANYNAGVYIMDVRDIDEKVVEAVGRFDLYPPNDDPEQWHGAWTAYPYFKSGIVAASSIDDGLFILQPHLPPNLLFLPMIASTS